MRIRAKEIKTNLFNEFFGPINAKFLFNKIKSRHILKSIHLLAYINNKKITNVG